MCVSCERRPHIYTAVAKNIRSKRQLMQTFSLIPSLFRSVAHYHNIAFVQLTCSSCRKEAIIVTYFQHLIRSMCVRCALYSDFSHFPLRFLSFTLSLSLSLLLSAHCSASLPRFPFDQVWNSNLYLCKPIKRKLILLGHVYGFSIPTPLV